MARLQKIADIDHEFKSLRISALRKAVEISPYVCETTIGPNSINWFKKSGDQSSQRNTKINDKQPPPRKKLDRTSWKSIQLVKPESGSVPIEKILHQCEEQRREATETTFNNMITNMVARRTEMMNKFWHQQELEYEKRAQDRRNREIEILLEWSNGDKLAKLEEQRLDEENRAHSERMKKLLEKQLESAQLFEKLNSNHAVICNLYQEITNMQCTDKHIHSKVLQKYAVNLSTILSSINLITEDCKKGSITSDAVDNAVKLAKHMGELKALILDEVTNTIKAAEVALHKAAIEEKTKEVEVPLPTVPVDSPPVKSDSADVVNSDVKPQVITKVKYCSNQSLSLYLEHKQYLQSYEASYKTLVDDPSMKRFRFDCQKAVNTPINAIASVNGSHLKDKYDKLMKLLNGDRVSVGDSYVSAAHHPLGKAYCTNLLAQKIVRQGELLVSSNPEAAFPIASVTVALWARFPEFGKLLTSHFHSICPYTVPMIMPQCEGQSDEDFYKARGYKYGEDGSIEKQDKFLKRMSGIFRLYAAVWVSRMPRVAGPTHPQGLCHAWRWLAAFINLDPEVDISATLIFDFLSVCGSDFFKHYKNQFSKILQLLMTDYNSKLQIIDEGGPKTRLEVYMQNIAKDGRLPPPTGMLSEHFW